MTQVLRQHYVSICKRYGSITGAFRPHYGSIRERSTAVQPYYFRIMPAHGSVRQRCGRITAALRQQYGRITAASRPYYITITTTLRQHAQLVLVNVLWRISSSDATQNVGSVAHQSHERVLALCACGSLCASLGALLVCACLRA
eukprot:161213-Pleurochrysis_carterae.AAC.2